MNKARNIVNKCVEAFSVFLMVVMVLLVLWQIIARYVLNSPSSFSEALTRYMFVWLVLVTATYAFGTRDHMRIELLLNAIHGKARRWVNIIIEVITVVFALLIMTFGGSIITRMQMVQSDSSLHIPMGVIYAIVPICGMITIFYCICNIREERMALKEGV